VRDAGNGGAGLSHKGDETLDEPDRAKHLRGCHGTFVTRLCRRRAAPF
jgi:hypothetical protein